MASLSNHRSSAVGGETTRVAVSCLTGSLAYIALKLLRSHPQIIIIIINITIIFNLGQAHGVAPNFFPDQRRGSKQGGANIIQHRCHPALKTYQTIERLLKPGLQNNCVKK
eukprot:795116-Amphidinium_carterae.1